MSADAARTVRLLLQYRQNWLDSISAMSNEEIAMACLVVPGLQDALEAATTMSVALEIVTKVFSDDT